MSDRLANLPFQLGSTWYNGRTIDSNNLEGADIIGKEYEIEDVDETVSATNLGVKNIRSRGIKRVRAVRNVSGFAILPKRWVKFDTTDGPSRREEIAGYLRTTADGPGGVVDEFLGSAGCPNNDVCWVVVEGPTVALTPLAGAEFAGAGSGVAFAVGDRLVSLTAVTTGATTAGRVALQELTAVTEGWPNQLRNVLGHALTARTSGNTNADILMHVYRQY